MSLIAVQATVFFENPAQMAITHETRTQMQPEDTRSPVALVGFDEDLISKISNNLKRLGGRVPNLNHGTVAGDTITTPPFHLREKS